MSRANKRLLTISVYIILLFFAGCGSENANRLKVPPPDSLNLPAPSTLLPREQPAQASMADLVLDGNAYDHGLPNNLVEDQGIAAHFSPQWGHNDEAKDFGDLAYAIYAFNPGLHLGRFSISTSWLIPPDEPNLWIGVADYSADIWRWYPATPATVLEFPDMGTILTMQTELLVAVVLTNISHAPPPPEPVLGSISIGDGALRIDAEYQDFGVDMAGGLGTSELLLVDANPAFAYMDDALDLWFIRAADADGAAWNPALNLGPAGWAWPSLALVGGNPAVACGPQLQYRRATAADGSAWDDPAVQISAEPLTYAKLFVVDGNPAIVYTTDNGSSDGRHIMYIRANDSLGASWPPSGVELHPGASGMLFYKPEARVIAGVPCVAFSYADLGMNNDIGIRFVSAQDAAGAAWNAPVDIFSAPQGFNDVRQLDLLDLKGKPGIGWWYERFPPNEAESLAAFRCATDSAGAAWLPQQDVFSQGLGYSTLVFAQFNVLDIGGQLYATGKAAVTDALDNQRGEVLIVPVSPEGLADWAGTHAHLHVYFNQKSLSSLPSPTGKQGSCILSGDSMESLDGYDAIWGQVFIMFLYAGILQGTDTPGAVYTKTKLDAADLVWE